MRSVTSSRTQGLRPWGGNGVLSPAREETLAWMSPRWSKPCHLMPGAAREGTRMFGSESWGSRWWGWVGSALGWGHALKSHSSLGTAGPHSKVMEGN